MNKKKLELKIQSSWSYCYGCGCHIGLFIKPSALIPIIAILLIELVSFFEKKWQSKGRLVLRIIAVLTAGVTYAVCNQLLESSSILL